MISTPHVHIKGGSPSICSEKVSFNQRQCCVGAQGWVIVSLGHNRRTRPRFITSREAGFVNVLRSLLLAATRIPIHVATQRPSLPCSTATCPTFWSSAGGKSRVKLLSSRVFYFWREILQMLSAEILSWKIHGGLKRCTGLLGLTATLQGRAPRRKARPAGAGTTQPRKLPRGYSGWSAGLCSQAAAAEEPRDARVPRLKRSGRLQGGQGGWEGPRRGGGPRGGCEDRDQGDPDARGERGPGGRATAPLSRGEW